MAQHSRPPTQAPKPDHPADYDTAWRLNAPPTELPCHDCKMGPNPQADRIVREVFGTPLCYGCLTDRKDAMEQNIDGMDASELAMGVVGAAVPGADGYVEK